MKTATQTLKRKTAFVFKGKSNASGAEYSQLPTTTTIVTLPSLATCTGRA